MQEQCAGSCVRVRMTRFPVTLSEALLSGIRDLRVPTCPRWYGSQFLLSLLAAKQQHHSIELETTPSTGEKPSAQRPGTCSGSAMGMGRHTTHGGKFFLLPKRPLPNPVLQGALM